MSVLLYSLQLEELLIVRRRSCNHSVTHPREIHTMVKQTFHRITAHILFQIFPPSGRFVVVDNIPDDNTTLSLYCIDFFFAQLTQLVELDFGYSLYCVHQ